ncbi:carbohydrate-binding domain-containing protein [Deinococcus peraridilitoris]|uniref:carbohydrate-binding domain-containing protein n=1 Tax=Deinococcus peraridilitoris TaxID=432329 RepID=UPI001FE1A852|nr:carbohydrate-binding domain-containing protein [Deinococcus peraridilitoris]
MTAFSGAAYTRRKFKEKRLSTTAVVSGEYVRARIKGVPYRPIDRTAYAELAWSFENDTQGFGVNSDSPDKTVTVTHDRGALKLSSLGASNDVSTGGFWSNLRISADGSSVKPNILGAKSISMDVFVPAPTTVSIAAVPQSSNNGWTSPARAVVLTADQFTLQPDQRYKATLILTDADAPNLQKIAEDETNNVLSNIIFFVGTASTASNDTVWLDNITFHGHRVAAPVIHDPLGTATLPSSFENGTRQGWDWDGESGVKSALRVQQANGSNALSWEVIYPDVKPAGGWASAPRLVLNKSDLTRGVNSHLTFDLYLQPERASAGALQVNLAFGPPSLGYWAQASETVQLDLTTLGSLPRTPDGLYHVKATFDLTKINDAKVLAPDTQLGKITLVVADINSNYAGKMYLDNVRFSGAP